MKTLSVYNPSKEQLQLPHDTFNKVWNKAVEKGLQNETHFVFEFMVHDRNKTQDTETVSVVKWEFEMQYLKAKCFDESKNLPYKMTEEIVKQAFLSIGILKYNYNLPDLAEWLERVVGEEREELKRQYQKQKQ